MQNNPPLESGTEIFPGLLSARALSWPTRATTKISLAAPRYPLEESVGWGFLRGVWVTKQSTA